MGGSRLFYLLITKGPTGHLQCYTKTQKYNKTHDYLKLRMPINRADWRTFIAALAEDSGVLMNDENELDESVERDQGGHDDHAPLGQTELPDPDEHCYR